MPTRYSKYLPAFVFISDLFLLNMALYSSQFMYKLTGLSLRFTILVDVGWLIVTILSKNYYIRRPLVLKDNINRFMLTLIYHLLFVFGGIYFFKIYYATSRSEVMIVYSLFFLFVMVHRSVLFFFLDQLRKKGYNHRQIVVLGDGNIASRLVDSFGDHPEYGYDLIDFISDQQIINTTDEALFKKLLNKRPDEIFICYKQIDAQLLSDIIEFGDNNHIKIKVVSDLMLNNKYAELVNYHSVPVLQIRSHPEIELKIRVVKRSFDLCFALFVMVFGLPIFILLYFITRFTSPGPAFYRQERMGQNQKPFYMYKFRSMYINSEKFGPQLSSADDPRITKWGRIIRQTRLDELPQFWNVLKGEMSVVGPRPERQHFIEKIIERTPNYKKLLHLKPGLTSMGQVHYGYAENVDQMCDRMRYDLIYLQNMNLNSDLNIIIKTVKVMVLRKGK